MRNLFTHPISGIESWGAVYQSINAFEPLAREIFRRARLRFDGLSNLTPGTNAVFGAGEWVLKIYAPPESGFSGEYATERAAMKHAEICGVAAPRIAASGTLCDRYDFDYIIMERVRGGEASSVLRGMDEAGRTRVVAQVRDLLARLNVACGDVHGRDVVAPVTMAAVPPSFSAASAHTAALPPCDALPVLTIDSIVGNPRLGTLPPSLAADIRQHVATLNLEPRVVVHGDVTDENVLIDGAGAVYLIDFADALLAPVWYEYACVVPVLFGGDVAMIREFARDVPDFAKRLVDALCVHRFAPNIITFMCEHIGIAVPTDVDGLTQIVKRHYA